MKMVSKKKIEYAVELVVVLARHLEMTQTELDTYVL